MKENNFQKVINFINTIGIKTQIVHFERWEQKQCFLPNILLDLGMLKIDPTARIGDILHEAGHLATFPARLRPFCNNATISCRQAMVDTVSAAEIEITDRELDILQYCYDDQAPQGWQYAANIYLGLNSRTGFDIRFAEGEGRDVHDSIALSIGTNFGHRTSVTLYYLSMVASKSSFPTMLKWLNN